MPDRKQVRRAMFLACLRFNPPLVRNALLSDNSLSRKFGIAGKVSIEFGDSGVVFVRPNLYSAVKSAIRKPGKGVALLDRAGAKWDVTVSLDRKNPEILFKSGNRGMRFVHLLLLGDSKAARLHVIDSEAKRLCLPSKTLGRWRKLASKRSLTGDELDELVTEFSRSPIAVGDAIAEQLNAQRVSLENLVPRSLPYYEGLVGQVSDQKNFREYLGEVASSHIADLMKRPNGLKLALLLGASPLVSESLRSHRIPAGGVRDIIGWAPGADVLSKCALVETMWPLALSSKADINGFKSLIGTLAGVGINHRHDPYDLFSASFLVTYGQLAKTKILSGKPIYWRRFAALAHAGVITRAILACPADLSKFVAWMGTARSQEYAFQVYADLRSEPRWLPEWGFSGQLRNEFGGRILVLALRDKQRTKRLGVYDVLLGNVEPSLKLQLEPLRVTLPGPVEGNLSVEVPFPDDVLAKTRQNLNSPAPDMSSFAPLVNLANVFKVPADLPDLAADALRRAQYYLEGDTKYLWGTLTGLATLAALARSARLADELFILMRNYRRVLKSALDLDAAFRIGVVACASRQDLMDWCKCVGAFVSELAFGDVTREEASALYRAIIGLCDIVPELWSTCGSGLAATEAVAMA